MKTILDTAGVDRLLRELADRVAAAAPADAPTAIIGIRRRGATLAERLAPMVRERGVQDVRLGALDITLYRDDLTQIGPNAKVRRTEIDFDLTGAWVVLVDDVLYTGRSVRAALDALTDLGRPRAIKLAIFVDRGWRELPIHADFVGMTVETAGENIVKVKLREVDGDERVDLV
jgi:pyrimidine operon attenuation protein/uracil phosphoribosyltransferase